MKPEQLRERMELFGFGKGKKESDLFLRDVCDEYENLYYSLVEKEDKVNALNDAVKYYKNMEDNIKQMLSTISQISNKMEIAAAKSSELAMKEAESKANTILADASAEAGRILEEAKQEAKKIVDQAELEVKETREESAQLKKKTEAYTSRFYEFLEAQKAFFEENLPDPDPLPVIQPVQLQDIPLPVMPEEMPAITIEPEREPEETDTEEKGQTLETAQEVHRRRRTDDITVNQIRKIPNLSAPAPSIEEIQAKIPEHVRKIPISDHTETLDEIIQSIKKSYEEVENRE